MEVIPDNPGPDIDDGYFVMIVTARNPAATPVIVKLPPSGDGGPSVTFAYRVSGPNGVVEYNTRKDAPEDVQFAAHEAKRFIFDFRVGRAGREGSRYVLPPGIFRFDGSYGDAWAPHPPTVPLGQQDPALAP